MNPHARPGAVALSSVISQDRLTCELAKVIVEAIRLNAAVQYALKNDEIGMAAHYMTQFEVLEKSIDLVSGAFQTEVSA